MIEFTNESYDYIVVAKISGKLTVADYQNTIIPQLENLIAQYGKVSALIEMDVDFKGWELQAMYLDMKYGLKHRKDFAKLALVNASPCIAWLTKMTSCLMTAETKVFALNERDSALKWINS